MKAFICNQHFDKLTTQGQNIADRILKVEKVAWRDILPLQPDNIKHVYNYAWIENTVHKYGYANAFVVWQDEDGKIYSVDGHIRKDVFGTIEGMPEMLTAVFIHCEDKEEATKILLEVYNQKSNPIDKEVLFEWLEVQEISVSEIAIDTINVIEITEEEEESETAGQESSPVIKLQYSPDEHEMVLEGLSRIAQTPEAAVWELLGLDEVS